MLSRAFKLRILALVAVLGAAGCGGEDSGEDGGGSGLLDALGKVRATAESRVFVEYGAPRLVPDGDRFARLRGFGYGEVATTAKLVEEKLGLDLTGFDAGVVAGRAPRWAGAVWGEYDSAAVEGRLAELEVKKEGSGLGGTRWRAGKDDEIDLADGPFAGMVGLNQFNTLLTAKGLFAYSPAAAELDWIAEPGDATLADDDVLGPLARCLGDVIAANLTGAGEAVGARADGTEVICLAADRGTVEKGLDGDVASTRQPWRELLPGAKVDESEGRTRVTVPPSGDRPVGRVFQLLQTRDLQGLE